MPELATCPPWLRSDWAALHARHSRRQLPHALLITGVEGIGKRQFAQFVGESLLCRQLTVEQGACGTCESCRQLLAESHPDYRKLVPEGASETIKVDSVRELVVWLQLTAQQNSYKLSLIESADRMNMAAANSLLKTLEEPSDAAILILVADRPGALPATVRSRCQCITLKQQDPDAAVTWLADRLAEPELALRRAQGAPMRALAAHESDWHSQEALLLKAWQDLLLHRASVGRIVDALKDFSTADCLRAFSRWTVLAMRNRTGLPTGADPAVSEAISQVQGQLDSEQWFTIHDRLLQLNRSDSASFKTQTVLEGLFCRYPSHDSRLRCLND